MSSPIDADAVVHMSATSLARKVASGDLSARSVAEGFLARIEAVNADYNAIISLRPQAEILAEADEADRARASGRASGRLHGLPLAVKDLANTKGLRTTLGSPLFADNVPNDDGLAVARMRAAGAIIIGKTNTPEFGLGSHTFNPIFGATRNAFDPTRSAGGSSGGAAVALATFMLPVADGSDFGGSLRNPAAWNNIFGFRPSQGRVPSYPAPDAFMSQMSTDGPMARHVEDLALLLSVQAGRDVRAPLSLEGTGIDFTDGLDQFSGGRIAWLGDFGGHIPFEEGVLDLCRAGLDRLESLNCAVESITPDFDPERLWQAFTALRSYSTGGKLFEFFEDPARRALLKPEAQWECECYARLSARDVYQAALARSAWYDCVMRLFERFDFLALPSAQVFPFPIAERWPTTIAGRTMDSYLRWMEIMAPVSMSGCPAVNIPVGFGPKPNGHLPMGIQIVARPAADHAALRLAHAYERANPWIAEARN